MALQAVVINGTTFYASDVKEDIQRIGKEKIAANGARGFALRAVKRQWTISFEQVPLATLTAARAIAALAFSFTFVDEQGTSFTAYCGDAPISRNVAKLTMAGGVQDALYTFDLTILES